MAAPTTTLLTALRTATPEVLPLLLRQLSEDPIPTPAPTGTFMTTKQVIIPGITNDHVTKHPETINIAIPTCIQTISPDPNGYVPPGSCGAIWHYYPTFFAAVAFAVIFAILTALHIWLAARYKKSWSWVIIMANIWEMMAFVFRSLSSKNQQSSGVYLVFQIFILLAPLWFNAYAYMVLGRMIHFFTPTGSLMGIPASTIGTVFVLLDIAAFIVQLVGGTMAGPLSSPEDLRRALNIYMAGIGLQQFFIMVFVAFAIQFQREMGKGQRAQGQANKWRPLLLALYICLGMVTIRIIYRLAEFSSGSIENPLTTSEAYFFALEAVPMVIASAIFVWVYPGRTINGPGSEMPSLWVTVKNVFSRKGRKPPTYDDSEQQRLAGSYVMLDGPGGSKK